MPTLPPNDLSDPFWTPGLSSKLRSKLRYYDPADPKLCQLRGLNTEVIPRAITEDYIIADATLADGSIQRIIVHKDNVIWPKVEKLTKTEKKSPSQGKEIAKLIKALAKQYDPERLAMLMGQVGQRDEIPY